MQVTDGKSLFYFALPATLLAQPGADAPERRREGKILRNYLRCLPVVTSGDLRDEVGDVEPGWTSSATRADSVACMIGEEQFERGLARSPHFL